MRWSAIPALVLLLMALASCSRAAPRAQAAPSAAYTIETIAEGLDHPWGLAFLPDGAMLVTERVGRLRLIAADGKLQAHPIAGVPPVFARGQGGLLDIALDPDFAKNRLIYLSYAAGTAKSNATRLARARFTGRALERVEVLFEVNPRKATSAHFGGRIAFLPDGTLLLTLGEGYDYKDAAQDLASDLGKIVRLNRDGTIPADNPFVGKADVRPEIYTYGHRNVQGLVVDGISGRIYAHEHGPKGGDELNLLRPGANYGWPVITYGIDYSGLPISRYKKKAGMEQPIVYWVPSIAPSGMTLYTGQAFAEWRGDMFIGALAGMQVRRLDLRDGAVIGQEILFTQLEERIRDVRQSPDGSLILLTDSSDGRVLRVRPRAIP